jgi:hypothetical protein
VSNGADGLSIVFEGAPNAFGYGLPATKEALAATLDDVPLGRLDLRIPPKAMVEASEALLAAEDYPIPAYYFEVFPGATPHVPDKLRLQRMRIADYTISNCA